MNERTKRIIFGILTVVLFSSIAFYVLFQFVRQNFNEYETFVASPITLWDDVKSEATVFMDEVIVQRKTGGEVYYLVDNGERVGKNDPICDVYSEKIEKFDTIAGTILSKKLELYKKSNSFSSVSFSTMDELDEAIHNEYISMIKSRTSGDYSAATSHSENILVALNRRLITLGKVDSFDSVITDLTLQINSLKNTDISPNETVTASVSGYFFSDVDGFETDFDMDLLNNITIEDYRDLVSQKPSVIQDNVVGKICTSYNWKFCCEVPSSTSAQMISGEYYDVSFSLNNGIVVKALLERKIEQPKFDRAVLVFNVDRFPVNFNFRRTQDISLTSSKVEGVKVPKAAVRALDGNTGVYVIENNTIKFKTIHILHNVADFYICAVNSDSESSSTYSEINEYDTVIVNGKDIYDGKTVG